MFASVPASVVNSLDNAPLAALVLDFSPLENFVHEALKNGIGKELHKSPALELLLVESEKLMEAFCRVRITAANALAKTGIGVLAGELLRAHVPGPVECRHLRSALVSIVTAILEGRMQFTASLQIGSDRCELCQASLSMSVLSESTGYDCTLAYIVAGPPLDSRLEGVTNNADLFRTLMNASNDSVIYVSRSGGVLETNTVALESLGVASENDIRGISLFDLDVQPLRDLKLRHFYAAIRLGQSQIFQFESAGQSWRCIISPLFGTGCEVASLAVVTQLMGDKGRDNNLFSASGSSFHKYLFDDLKTGIVVVRTPDGGNTFVIEDVNDKALELSQRKREDTVGKRDEEVFPGHVRSGFVSVVRGVWLTGIPHHLPELAYEDQGRKHWREIHTYKLCSGEVIVEYSDLTERKNTIEELRRSIEDLKDRLGSIGMVRSEMRGTTVPAMARLGFTPTEVRIVEHVRTGMRSAEIARLLNASVLTVNSHIRNIRRKLGLNGREINLRVFLSEWDGVAELPSFASRQNINPKRHEE